MQDPNNRRWKMCRGGAGKSLASADPRTAASAWPVLPALVRATAWELRMNLHKDNFALARQSSGGQTLEDIKSSCRTLKGRTARTLWIDAGCRRWGGSDTRLIRKWGFA